jgi:hypothetical protein
MDQCDKKGKRDSGHEDRIKFSKWTGIHHELPLGLMAGLEGKFFAHSPSLENIHSHRTWNVSKNYRLLYLSCNPGRVTTTSFGLTDTHCPISSPAQYHAYFLLPCISCFQCQSSCERGWN